VSQKAHKKLPSTASIYTEINNFTQAALSDSEVFRSGENLLIISTWERVSKFSQLELAEVAHGNRLLREAGTRQDLEKPDLTSKLTLILAGWTR